MRILHVVPSYLPAWRYGGPIYSVHGLARATAALGHEVAVFTTDADGPGRLDVPLERDVEIDGVRVRYFGLSQPRRLYRAPGLERALRREVGRFDVLHLHSLFLWPTWRAARAAEREQVPYVLAPRGMLVRDLVQRRSRLAKLAWLRLFEERNVQRASLLHATSHEEARAARAFGLELPPIAVVPNGVDLEPLDAGLEAGRAWDPPPGVTRGRYLLFLGRVQWKKGLPRLLHALAAAGRELHELPLLIAGPTENDHRGELELLARELGLARRVHFLGALHGAHKQAALEGSLALVLPSLQENFGNVVLESLAAGRPVIVTPEVGAAELVAARGCGWVSSGDAAPLARVLLEAWRDPGETARRGALGRSYVRRECSWRSAAQSMLAHYAGLLSSSACA